MAYDADVIVIGAGLAGLAATAELVDAGRKVILLDQEPEQSLGGQAHWSFGGLFFVDSPEQRRMRHQGQPRTGLAGLAGHRRLRPRRGPLAAPAGPRRTSTSPPARSGPGCTRRACGSSPSSAGPSAAATTRPGTATPCPASTSPGAPGPGVVEPFERRVREGVARGLVELRFRHRVTGLSRSAGAVDTVSGEVLEPQRRRARHGEQPRGRPAPSSSRAQAVIVTSGGIGGNHDLVRAQLARAARHPAASRCSPACPRTSTG